MGSVGQALSRFLMDDAASPSWCKWGLLEVKHPMPLCVSGELWVNPRAAQEIEC